MIQTHYNKFCDRKACINESETLKGCHWHTARTAINQKILTRISAAQQPAFTKKLSILWSFRSCNIILAIFSLDCHYIRTEYCSMRSLVGTFLIVNDC